MAKRNLLLVDADPRSVRVLEVSLRKAGYSVAMSSDVDGALELIAQSEPDLVIADTRLPGKDGFALVAALRERPVGAQVPLMFLSSDPSLESKVRGLELGVEEYLTKPLSIREILARVNLILERKEREGLGRTSKTRFSGSLEDMGLVDLLQTIDVSRKSGVLKLASDGRTGLLYFHEGRVLDAESGELRGEAAVYRFLLWGRGNFELEFCEVRREDMLGLPTQALLLEGVRRLDEWSRLQEQLPSLDAVLEVNHVFLAERLDEVADELNTMLRAFDGQRDIASVLDASSGDDLVTLNAVSKLFFDGFLVVRHGPKLAASAPLAWVGAPSDLPTSHSLRASDPGRGSTPSARASVSPVGANGSAQRDDRVRDPGNEVGDGLLAGGDDAASAHLVPGPLEQVLTSAEIASSEVVPSRESRPVDARVVGASENARGGLSAHASVAGAGTLTATTGAAVLVATPPDRVPSVTESDAPRARTALPSSSDLPESQRPPPTSSAPEGEDDMAKPGKSNAERRRESHDNVIALPVTRADSEPSSERPGSDRPAARSAEQIAQPSAAADIHHDDDPGVRKFFSEPSGTHHLNDVWDDYAAEVSAHPTPKGGMYWTVGIAGAGLIAIGAFLLYNKVFMPTPEELGFRPVALPTPDLTLQAPLDEPAAPAPEDAPSDPVERVEPAPAPAAETKPATAPVATERATPAPTAAANAPVRTPSEPAVAPSTQAGNAAVPAAAGSYSALLASARKLGFKRSAETSYLQALAARPDAPEALSGLAMFYLNQGKNTDARERARASLVGDPNNAEALIVLGAAASALGDQATARDAYARCAALPMGSSKYVLECKRMLR